MKACISWIKDFVSLEDKIEDICKKLTFAGLEVTSVERKGEDYVLEFEVTSNRSDWLSIWGVAKELAALYSKDVKLPKIPLYNKTLDIPIVVEDKSDCPFYTARVIENVRIEESPDYIKERLSKCEINSINNVVDITNYCLLEWGQPLHAFDLDKLELPLYIRRARDGEEVITLDGKRRILTPQILVIADRKKVVAVAGIMGALNTQVDNNTHNILIESANFNPVVIRRSARLLGLGTPSSYRFERGVFDFFVDFCSRKCVDLIVKECGGAFKGFSKVGTPEIHKKKIVLKVEELSNLLSIKINPSIIQKILKNLGFRIISKDRKSIKVEVPFFRRDINIKEDLIEEVARIYGYDKVKEELPPVKFIPLCRDMFEFKSILKDFLSLQGIWEVVTFSLISNRDLESFRMEKEQNIFLLNPLSRDYSILRNSLLPSLMKVVAYNSNRGENSFRFFEIANIYYRQNNKIKEKPILGIVISGKKSNYYKYKDLTFDFYDLKGILFGLLYKLGIKKMPIIEEYEVSYLEYAGKIVLNKEEIGFLGKVKEEIIQRYDLKYPSFYAQLDINKLFKYSFPPKKIIPFSKYPPVLRDISFIVDENLKFSEIEKVIRSCKGAPFIEEIQLLDIYRGENIPLNKKSLLIRLVLREKTKTLTSSQADSIVEEIKTLLKRNFSALIR